MNRGMRYLSAALLLAGLTLAAGDGFSAPLSQGPEKTMDAADFARAYNAWTSTHSAPMQDDEVSAGVLAVRAKQGDAKASFLLGTSAEFQDHPEMAYDLYLKAMGLGLTVPVVVFIPDVEPHTAPPEHLAESRNVLRREHQVAWALVGAIRGDEYSAGIARFYSKGINDMPLNDSQIAVACQLAADDYRKIQAMRQSLGKPAFASADNVAQTVFLDNDNPWPITFCPNLPIPAVHCEQVRLVGSTRGLQISPGEKAYQCTATAPAASIAAAFTHLPAPVPAPASVSAVPPPPLILGPTEIMKAASTEPLDDESLYAPDSGSDSDPERQYHFTVGSSLYVIESAGGAVVHTADAPQKVYFEVPSAPIYIDGPVYHALYHGDLILLYLTDMPGDTPQQKAEDPLVYLVRIQTSDLSLQWSISGIPPDIAPGVISGPLIFVGSNGFLGAINLDTGQYLWCLGDLNRDSGALFGKVKPPFIRNRDLVLESLKPNSYGSYAYVAVNLDTHAVSTNLPGPKPQVIVGDCPYIR